MSTLGRILIVEDDPNDVELTLTALEEYKLANEVVVTRDGEEALDYLYCRGNFKMREGGNPAVMLLDLKLPKVDGLEVLQQIKIEENRFGFEPEITAKVSKLKECRIYEVGISYYGRTYAEGKKIGRRDGFRAIYAVLKYNLFR